MDLRSMELNVFGEVNEDPDDGLIHMPITLLNNYTPGIIIRPPDYDNDRYLLPINKTIFEYRSDIRFPKSILEDLGWSKKKTPYIVHGKYDAEILQVFAFTAHVVCKGNLEENTAVLIMTKDYIYNRFYPEHISKEPTKTPTLNLNKMNLKIRFTSKGDNPYIWLSEDVFKKLGLSPLSPLLDEVSIF